MLYREIIAVCSEIHTKHINTLCGQNAKILSAKPGGAGPSGRAVYGVGLGPLARIPPGGWMFVCCECCVLSGRGLCDGLITRPEESYRL